MEIRLIDADSFPADSLLRFNRHQTVGNVYRQVDGQLVLTYNPFEEDWSPERIREKTAEILGGRYTVFCAYDGELVAGLLMLVPELDKGRMIVSSLHVSEEYRRKGVGRALIEAAKTEARAHGARALYLSACSAEETIEFYRAMGFGVSPDPIKAYADDEPFDIQMQCPLQ